MSGVPEARAQELIDATTSCIYSHMSTILSANHRELLALLLALERLRSTHRLTDNEMSMWLGQPVTEKFQLHLLPSDDVCPHWLPHEVALSIFAVAKLLDDLPYLTLPYLTLPYGEDVLPPSTEASNGPNAHPRINRKVTKFPSVVLTRVTPIMEPSPSANGRNDEVP